MNGVLPGRVTKWLFGESRPLRWEPAGEVTVSTSCSGQAQAGLLTTLARAHHTLQNFHLISSRGPG